MLKDIVSLSWPFILAFVSSYLTYYFTKKTKRSEASFRFKEEKYTNLVIFLKGFVGGTASTDLKRKFFDEQYKSWLYCSDDVVKAINRMVKIFIDSKGQTPDAAEGKKVMGGIVKSMRRDLLGKTNLTENDFVYTNVVD